MLVYYQMDPIEPVSEENSESIVEERRDDGQSERSRLIIFGVFTDMVSTISPALMLFFLIISANNAGDIFSCQLRVFLKK